MSYKASKAAAAGFFAVAGLLFLFAVAFTATGSASLANETSVEAQFARDAAAKRLAGTIKRSSSMIAANPKGGNS